MRWRDSRSDCSRVLVAMLCCTLRLYPWIKYLSNWSILYWLQWIKVQWMQWMKGSEMAALPLIGSRWPHQVLSAIQKRFILFSLFFRIIFFLSDNDEVVALEYSPSMPQFPWSFLHNATYNHCSTPCALTTDETDFGHDGCFQSASAFWRTRIRSLRSLSRVCHTSLPSWNLHGAGSLFWPGETLLPQCSSTEKKYQRICGFQP